MEDRRPPVAVLRCSRVVKPPLSTDYNRNDATDPGDASDAARPVSESEPSVIAEGAEGEFPSEATRIDAGSSPPPRRKLAKRLEPAASPGRADTRRAPGAPANSKLAALQSLSLDSGKGSTSSRGLPPAHRGQGSSKLPWVLLSLVLLGIGGNWAWMRFHPSAANNPHPVQSIKTEVVHPTGGNGAVQMASGFTAAREPIAVGAPVGGRIKDVKIQNGDKFRKNQVIVLLDDSSALGDMSVARAEVHDAERTLARTVMLYKAQAATQIDVEKARGAAEIARARLRPIEQRIDQMKIRAPIEGTVLEVLVHVGEAVNASAPVVKVADLRQLLAEADINESDIRKIRRGQAVTVTSDAFVDKQYQGVVREIAEQADKARGTVQVKVDLTVPDQTLRPGMSVKCAFQPDKGEKPRIFVSKSSLTAQGGVWVVGADRRITHRALKTQAGTGASIEVLEGLRGGEEIVVESNLVHEGQVLPQAGS